MQKSNFLLIYKSKYRVVLFESFVWYKAELFPVVPLLKYSLAQAPLQTLGRPGYKRQLLCEYVLFTGSTIF